MRLLLSLLLLLVVALPSGADRRGILLSKKEQAAGGGASGPGGVSSGLTVWLKADALSLSDNDPVATWTDSSGSGNDFAQATSGFRPTYKTGILNGKAVVRFDGSDDVLTHAALGLSAATVFVVFTANDSDYVVLSTDNGVNNGYWRWTGDGNGYFDLYRASRINTYPSTMPTAASQYLTLISSASTYEVFRGGVGDGAQAASFADGALSLGQRADGTVQFAGDVAEVIIFNRAVNSTERGDVESYLATKYGL
jgi:hypothetical protein